MDPSQPTVVDMEPVTGAAIVAIGLAAVCLVLWLNYRHTRRSKQATEALEKLVGRR